MTTGFGGTTTGFREITAGFAGNTTDLGVIATGLGGATTRGFGKVTGEGLGDDENPKKSNNAEDLEFDVDD